MTKKNFRCELLEVPGADNVRDIGGYKDREGRPVRSRRFIRAGDMSGLTPAGIQAVRALGVGCIVDLRSTAEITSKPDTLAEDEHIRYVHVPMLDYIQSSISSGDVSMFPASMEAMYRGVLDKAQGQIQRVFQAFAHPDYDTVLFHCTAGKDRTGICAMLLLGLVGVNPEDIVEDYSYSEELIDFPIDPNLPAYLFRSKPEAMEATWEHLTGTYGNVSDYLSHIGVDAAMQEAVRQKLRG